jgi:drug/metabolite transporter (DMT)-like permease
MSPNAGQPPAQAWRLGVGFALVSAAGYGLNAVTAQIAASVGLNGALMVFYRTLLMLAGVAAAVLIWRARLGVAQAEWPPLIVFSLTSSVIGTAYLSSVAFLPVSVAVVIFYLFPVLIVLAEPFVERRRPSALQLGVVALAFAGVALAVGPSAASLDPRGVALALLAAVGAAAQFFAAARMPQTGAAAKLFWSHLIVLPIVALTLAVVGGFKAPNAFAAAPVAVAVTIGAYLSSFALQLLALARVSAAAGGLAFCAEPIFATVFAALILGERLGPLQYAGGALVLAAIMADVIARERRAARAAAAGMA